KEFKTSMRGYHQEEVDEFLDIIIQDYHVFQQKINQLTRENKRLKQSEQQLKIKQDEEEPQRKATQPTQPVNYETLQRSAKSETTKTKNKTRRGNTTTKSNSTDSTSEL